MATLFCDFENGNDNHGGTSFALLASGTDGRINAVSVSTGTFSAATANFPNDGSLINQYINIFNGTTYNTHRVSAWVSSTSLTVVQTSTSGGGLSLVNTIAVDRQYYIGGRWKNLATGATAVRTVPGDTIRIMGSPAPTSLGQNGVWTSQVLQGTKSISSSTNATPIAVTVTAHGYSTGDTVVITGHTANTNANGTWEITSTGANTFTLDGSVGNGVGASGTVRLRNNTRVMLTTAVTQNIASTGPGRVAWVASTDCTHTFNTAFYKEGVNSDALFVGSAFTTGKSHYYTLPATLDLSAFQQVSMWIYTSGGDLTAGQAELRLCSDTTGETVVDTVPLDYTPAGKLRAYTWDKGSALGSSIASVSLYINSDLWVNNVNVVFSNIIACRASSAADSLTLTSLIGKNTTGETFWGIQSINGTRVMLDAYADATPITANVRGYYGTSGTVATWKRETIKLGPAATSTTALQTVQEVGTDGSPIIYSGGWDRTNMSTQNLETWLDGVNGNGYLFNIGGISFINLEKFGLVRSERGISANNSSNFSCIYNIIAANNNSIGVIEGGNGNTYNVNFACANSSSGVQTSRDSLNYITAVANSNGSSGVSTVGGFGSLSSVIAGNNASSGLNAALASQHLTQNSVLSDNGTGGIFCNGILNCSNVLVNNAIEFTFDSNSAARVFSHNHDQVLDNHKIFMNGALISSAIDQRHTASGISWKIQPTSTNRSSAWPVTLSLAKVACSANNLVTIKAWMRRDNSGLTMRLVCKGGQIAGVASDVTASVTTTNTWEEETITFTPTQVGVVEIIAEAWGGSTFSGWVDDLTILQS